MYGCVGIVAATESILVHDSFGGNIKVNGGDMELDRRELRGVLDLQYQRRGLLGSLGELRLRGVPKHERLDGVPECIEAVDAVFFIHPSFIRVDLRVELAE